MTMDGHLLVPAGVHFTPCEREVREERARRPFQRLERTARKELEQHRVPL